MIIEAEVITKQGDKNVNATYQISCGDTAGRLILRDWRIPAEKCPKESAKYMVAFRQLIQRQEILHDNNLQRFLSVKEGEEWA